MFSNEKRHDVREAYPHAKKRFVCFLLILIALVGILVWRMLDLTIRDRHFLEKQGNARSVREVNTPAYRGMILDRHGVPLAVSTPVDAIWVNPREVNAYLISKKIDPRKLAKLAAMLDMPLAELKKKMTLKQREFIYLARGLDPLLAENIKALKIVGIHSQEEFKRYYPDAEVTSQLVGFTDIDDHGQEGLELAYNSWLKGEPGKKLVLKDRLGHILSNIKVVSVPQAGKNLTLSIDRRIQYAAYRELKKAIAKLKARSGTAVVMDAKTGEILAMVNQPSYNPNNRSEISSTRIRNRALTDTFEPGSVMKAFSVASGVNSGKYHPNTDIDIGKGWMMVGGHPVVEEHATGILTVTEVLQKSSNIGVTKITLSLPPDDLVDLLRRAGFGEKTNTGFPGESAGVLPIRTQWKPFALATLAFGYGLSVTPAQLVQGYGIFANHGKLIPLKLLLNQKMSYAPTQVMNPKAADEMLKMLQAVVEGGSGTLAKVKGYQVAGKTGTSRIAGSKGYDKNHHIATFAGIAPVSSPRLVVVVVVNDPKSGGLTYYAATAAAPVFSRIMDASLKILDVPPDAIDVPKEKK